MKTHFAGTSHKAKADATKRGGHELPHLALKISASSIARALGVEKGHLCRVLKGKRKSAELMSRYYTYLADYRALSMKSAKPAKPVTETAK